MPKFSEVAEMLKKRYDHFAVQVEMDVITHLYIRIHFNTLPSPEGSTHTNFRF